MSALTSKLVLASELDPNSNHRLRGAIRAANTGES